jgi:hypothetical protein
MAIPKSETGIKLIDLPPELAVAIVEGQRAVEAVIKDGHNKQLGKAYATSEAIAAAAKRALNSAGAAPVRMSVDTVPNSLQNFDLGNQAYCGDTIETWAIVHESGAAIVGSFRMPVVVSKGRPHEKAVSATLSYNAGVVLRGLLCMEREDKHAVDRREDADDGRPMTRRDQRGPADPREGQPRCSGKAAGIAAGNVERTIKLAAFEGSAPASVWRRVCGGLGIPPDYIGNQPSCPKAERLTTSEGQAVRKVLDAALDAHGNIREPGDDRDDDEAPY